MRHTNLMTLTDRWLFLLGKEVMRMAATRLIALHVNKGKTVAQCLADRTDYSQNAAKTNDGEFISSYECDPKTADEEFLLSKRQYQHITGRQQKNNIIAYQIRQSFKPGEITPEEANQVGYETAMRWTKGKHAFIVATHIDKSHSHKLIDIQAKMAEGKTVGYEKWAKKFNRKEAARTVILLKDKGLGNYDDLTAHIENLSARFDALSDSIKAAEKRMVEVQALQQHIKNYRNTRQIYIEYRKSGYSKKFFEEHRQEITIHKAAKQAFDELQITKLPSMQSLYEEFHQLAVQKKQDYAEYRQIRKEKEELLIAKRTVETILNIDRQKEQEKEQEKEEKKNFR